MYKVGESETVRITATIRARSVVGVVEKVGAGEMQSNVATRVENAEQTKEMTAGENGTWGIEGVAGQR